MNTSLQPREKHLDCQWWTDCFASWLDCVFGYTANWKESTLEHARQRGREEKVGKSLCTLCYYTTLMQFVYCSCAGGNTPGPFCVWGYCRPGGRAAFKTCGVNPNILPTRKRNMEDFAKSYNISQQYIVLLYNILLDNTWNTCMYIEKQLSQELAKKLQVCWHFFFFSLSLSLSLFFSLAKSDRLGRHPNYFGEFLFHCGISCFSCKNRVQGLITFDPKKVKHSEGRSR